MVAFKETHEAIFNVQYMHFMANQPYSYPLDKMAAISQTIFSDAFSWMEIFVFWFNFHWSFFLWVQLTIHQHWFR